MEAERDDVLILGAGPAGLTAAWELMKHEVPVTVIEKDPRYVGGLARTVEHRGYRFDIGGHRFFSQNEEPHATWPELLRAQLLSPARLPRLYTRGRFSASP